MYKIAIPSLDRPKGLKNKTLKTLKENNIPSNLIHIFLHNEEEKKKYVKELGDEYKIIVINQSGMKNMRNAMVDYFENDEKIVYCDDDITAIGTNECDKLEKIYTLKSIIDEAWNLCEYHNLKKWGLHPSNNPRSLKRKTITTDLRYIIGVLYGEINDKSLKNTVSYAEDFEKTILYYKKYGGVLRFNYLTAVTRYYAKGGHQTNGRTIEKEKDEKMVIVNKYPQYAKLFTRPNGRTDIRLIRNPKI